VSAGTPPGGASRRSPPTSTEGRCNHRDHSSCHPSRNGLRLMVRTGSANPIRTDAGFRNRLISTLLWMLKLRRFHLRSCAARVSWQGLTWRSHRSHLGRPGPPASRKYAAVSKNQPAERLASGGSGRHGRRRGGARASPAVDHLGPNQAHHWAVRGRVRRLVAGNRTSDRRHVRGSDFGRQDSPARATTRLHGTREEAGRPCSIRRPAVESLACRHHSRPTQRESGRLTETPS
jgi:hypothetical protein